MTELINARTAEMSDFQRLAMSKLPAVADFCLRVVLALVVFWLGGKVIRWTAAFLRRSLERTKMDQGAAQFLASMAKFLLYAVLVFQIAVSIGVRESTVAALLGSAGVAIGLGLQGSLANVAGGMILLIFKPFQVGDYIKLGPAADAEGTVEKIDLCYTTLLTIDRRQIVIPNGTLSNSTIANMSAREVRRLDMKLYLSYDADLAQAKAIVERLLCEEESVQDEGKLVFVDELTETAAVLGLRANVAASCYYETRWKLNEQICAAFREKGIEMAQQRMMRGWFPGEKDKE